MIRHKGRIEPYIYKNYAPAHYRDNWVPPSKVIWGDMRHYASFERHFSYSINFLKRMPTYHLKKTKPTKPIIRIPEDIRSVECNALKLETLPKLPNTLRALECHRNLLTSSSLECLNALNSLVFLDCSTNVIEKLPENLPPKLEYLNIDNNKITYLPALPKTLKVLKCSFNRLRVFPFRFHIETLESDGNLFERCEDYQALRRKRASQKIANWAFEIFFKPDGILAKKYIERAKKIHLSRLE